MIYGESYEQSKLDRDDMDRIADEIDMEEADHADFMIDYEDDYPPENDWSWYE